MRVLKFGGTSVGDAESIKRISEIVRERLSEKPVLVFSACGHTTDGLESLGRKAAAGCLNESLEAAASLRDYHLCLVYDLLPEGEARWRLETLCGQFFASLKEVARSLSVLADFSPAVQDRLLSMGELLSTNILCDVLRHQGVPTEWVDARDLVVTDERHTRAEPIYAKSAVRCRETLLPILGRNLVPVTQGYIARSESGAITTLGRGGSDYTASLIGAALEADEIEIWTDVDGIMTADPSLVPQARNIPVMSFQEASELAFFGARVLHPKTLLPAVERCIPVRVLNSRRPESLGTTILAAAPRDTGPAKSIAYKEAVTLVNLVSTRMFKAHGFMRQLFETLDCHGISPDAVATSEVAVAMALHDPSGLEALADELSSFGTVSVTGGQALVCVVGEGLKEAPGVVSQVFEDLKDVRVSLVSQGGSAINLGFVVDEADLPRAVRRLHARFFERPSVAVPGLNEAQYGPPAIL